MKSCSFHYHQPKTVQQAVEILADVCVDEGRILAGGQTLIPAMAMRLARPTHLVDINRISELALLAVASDHLSIGACVRHAAFHHPVVDGPLGHLLSVVVRHIAHLPIRMRGTFCGSLANADAASEWCLVAATLNATINLRSIRGERSLPVNEFFLGFMSTAMEPDELLVATHLPLLPEGTHFGFEEYSRRSGDFAQAMSLVSFELRNGLMLKVRVGVGAVEGAARRLPEAEAVLESQIPSLECFARAAEAAAQTVEPSEPSDEEQQYKRELVRTVVLRALQKAAKTA